ncbi:MAG TPA: phosphoglucomutase/phosphomannomutase family protein [Candidatus Acidoferrales bacterium]|nr:phosphoglucomutase/phosphomannomutase family protein [Candidatus Acidoferrales bacterium]
MPSRSSSPVTSAPSEAVSSRRGGTIRFGTDGWRGIIADDFTHDNVRKVAYAIARYVVRAENPERGVLVGYDNRFASERFARTAAESLTLAGIPVWLAEQSCPTPAISLLVRQRGAAGGIVISASHNPAKWNGVKYKASYGSSALPSIVSEIEQELAVVLRDGVPALPPRPALIHSLDVRAPYLETLDKLVDWDRLKAAKLRFLIDPMHGSGAGLLKSLFDRHGIACTEIRGWRDPLFGGAHPEPIEPHIEPMRAAMLAEPFDAGFAMDGDADRIGAMDRDGTFVTPHQIFSILLWHLAGTRHIPGDVAKTFSVTKLVDKIAAKFGRTLHEVPVGFKYICELMLERDILLGGEESGGIGTKLHLPERDATVCALLLAEVLAWHRKSLGVILGDLHAEFGEHHYGRVDLELRPGQKEKALEYFGNPKLARHLDHPIVKREDMDGVKLYLGDAGWLMVRGSGTEPMLRLYAESSSAATTGSILDRTAALVRAL